MAPKPAGPHQEPGHLFDYTDKTGRRWTYDPDTQARYVVLRPDARIAHTKEVGPGVYVDVTDDDKIVGIEFI